jgi:hypothetical protein
MFTQPSRWLAMNVCFDVTILCFLEYFLSASILLTEQGDEIVSVWIFVVGVSDLNFIRVCVHFD